MPLEHANLLSKRSNKWYGWKPDTPDFRDKAHAFKPMAMRVDPQGGLFPGFVPKRMNQGNLGSCTGAASSRACMYLAAQEGQPTTPLSALFAYYNGRVSEGTVNEDSGCEIRDVVKGIAKLGICAEKLYPYNVNRFTAKPSARAYRDGHFTLLSAYQRIEATGPARVALFKQALAARCPVIFGFSVYDGFESDEVAKTGILAMPTRSQSLVGSHAVWGWKWDDNKVIAGLKGAALIVNSWDVTWGLGGDFWMPYAYLEDPDLSDDFWVLRTVT